jgi:RTX calcium-binding nonapeptide repeat (4 copies)
VRLGDRDQWPVRTPAGRQVPGSLRRFTIPPVQGISRAGWTAILTVVAGVLAFPAFAGAADPAAVSDRPLAGPSSVGDVRDYWTRERMRDAAPQSAAALFDSAHPVRCGRKLASIVGTGESDRLVGTSRPDVILGDRGNDTIIGKGGKDKLCGERGRDKLKGGGGKDLCDGGPSRDRAGRREKEKRVAG